MNDTNPKAHAAPLAGPADPFATGGCRCGTVRYALARAPYVVHCCHCHECQVLSGSAFAINAVVETECLTLLAGTVAPVAVPTHSGRGQTIMRCTACQTAVWSHYGSLGQKAAFVRAGTLDSPALCPPTVHIYVRTRLPWITLPDGIPAFDGFYAGRDVPQIYGAEGAARLATLRARPE